LNLEMAPSVSKCLSFQGSPCRNDTWGCAVCRRISTSAGIMQRQLCLVCPEFRSDPASFRAPRSREKLENLTCRSRTSWRGGSENAAIFVGYQTISILQNRQNHTLRRSRCIHQARTELADELFQLPPIYFFSAWPNAIMPESPRRLFVPARHEKRCQTKELWPTRKQITKH